MSFTTLHLALKSRLIVQACVCFFGGALGALAMPPLTLWPVLSISLPVLFICLCYSKTSLSSFLLGYLFWFGYFVFSLSWIGNALLVDNNPFAWAWIFAVLGLPALLAFFGGFSALIFHKFAGAKSPIAKWLIFSALISLFEFLRGHLFTGFPWNLFSYTWAETLPVLQVLRTIDIYTLNLLTIALMSSPALLVLLPVRRAIIAPFALITLFVGAYGYGLHSLHKSPQSFHQGVFIKLVQPNILQEDKWDAQKQAQNFYNQVIASMPSDAAENEDAERTTYILWPETAMTYRYTADETAMSEITTMLSAYKGPAYLLTGILNYDAPTKAYTNALVMIDKQGTISNIYNKHHLVPFGEYIPFQKWIPLQPIVEFSGFDRGEGPQIFKTPQDITYSPLICYEVIFPQNAVPEHQSADMILNVTNDAWYGISAGPFQHFQHARFRAIETATPIFRSANTGISGGFDGNGRMLGASELSKNEVISIPLPLKNSAPLENVYKNAIFLILTLILLTCSKLSSIRRTVSNCAL